MEPAAPPKPAATVSVQNNLPNADAGREGAGSQDQKQEETTNYEIGKTVRTIVLRAAANSSPEPRRTGRRPAEEKGANGALTWRPRTPEELESIARLVRSAIGFDDKRGDHVEVVNMRFAAEPEGAATEPRGLFGLSFDRADMMRLAQTALLGIVAIVALLMVLRPMVLRLIAPAPGVLALPGLTGAGASSGGGATPLEGTAAGALLATRNAAPGELPFVGGVAGMLEDESMVHVENVEGQLRASSVRRLAELIDKHPEESLSIVRSWMLQEPRA